MQNGISPSDRQSFLKSVREALALVEVILVERSSTERDLSIRSLRAVVYLRKLAKTPPHRLPIERKDHCFPKPIRIVSVVGDLAHCQNALALGCIDSEQNLDILVLLRKSVSEIEGICRRAKTGPAGLPRQCRTAFAMMKWLAAPKNFALYLKQVEIALRPFRQASMQRWPGTNLATGVVFAPNSYVWTSHTGSHAHTWQLQPGFLRASAQDLEDVAQIGAHGRNVGSELLSRHQRFLESMQFVDFAFELDALLHTA